MSRGVEEIVGINWGSSNFRAYRIAADGTVTDEYAVPSGVASLDRAGMVAIIDALATRWPGHGAIYASGMIGSNIGWVEAPYAVAPAGVDDLARATIAAEIGTVPARIVPGIACTRSYDGAPDILRGEEVELLGLAASMPVNGIAALPGTHTKWVRMVDGHILDFFTAMSGEIYDRLTGQGMLASIVEGDAADGPAFLDGVRAGQSRDLALATLLFGARARVIRGTLARTDSASYIRGLLIGSEIADARAICPGLADAVVPLIGNGLLSRLYAAALTSIGVETQFMDSREACVLGFRALHRAAMA